MIKVANFVIDEKFIDWQIEFQDMTKDMCQHDYYYVGNKAFKFIKNKNGRVKQIKKEETLDVISKYNAVFIHTIIGLPLDIVPKIEKKVKVFWFSWGFDIYSFPYGRPLVKVGLYHPVTRRYLIRDFKYQFIYLLKIINSYRKKNNRRYCLEAIKRVDFYSGVIDEEYDKMKSSIPEFRALKVDYSYWKINSFTNDNTFITDKRDIIIGNSTSFEINHLDIFEVIKKLDLNGRKIYVPLSYSPNPRYVAKIEKEGRRLFGDKFVAITNFMPFEEYMTIFNKCSSAIYGVERQMAMGNILMSLKNGCKVFLYKDSIVYQHLRKRGFKIFDIEEDLLKSNALQKLSDEYIKLNRHIFEQFYTDDVMVEKLHAIYKLIDK